MLRKYTSDPAHVVDWGELVINANETFDEGPVRIMDSREQVFSMQDCEASESVVETQRSGGGNMGT